MTGAKVQDLIQRETRFDLEKGTPWVPQQLTMWAATYKTEIGRKPV